MPPTLSLTPLQVLRLLVRLRYAAAGLQAAALLAVYLGLDLRLPWPILAAVPAGLALWNGWIGKRLRARRTATPPEVILHLTVDCLALTILLWFSGGPSNPFASLYLIPIALAAAATPAVYAWATAALCAALYGSLFWRHSIPAAGHEFFTLHVWGMWANFLVATVLLTAGLSALARVLRRRERALAVAREAAARNARIVATGTLAAGTAHELSTPLSTMAVLAGELRGRFSGRDDKAAQDLRLLEAQIATCKQRLRDMLAAADPARHGRPEPRPPKRFLEQIFDRWHLLRPEARATVHYEGDFPAACIHPEPALDLALTQLLDNAADASDDRIDVRCTCDDKTLQVRIEDDGQGLTEEQLARAGQGFFTTKPDGLGLGLVLSHSGLSHLGGEVRLLPRRPRGTCTEVRVPMAALRPEAD